LKVVNPEFLVLILFILSDVVNLVLVCLYPEFLLFKGFVKTERLEHCFCESHFFFVFCVVLDKVVCGEEGFYSYEG